jgi:predicted phosphohydrolase
VIAGDRYNSKSISESSDEFDLLCRLPGKKILIKGNHDLWWKNIGAMHKILSAFPSNSLNYLRNNYFEFEKYAICGATGVDMLLMNQNEVVNRRNRLRIEKSLQSASEKGLQPIVFLHYPPCLYDYQKHLHFDEELCEIFWKYNVKQCDYGHLHGEDCKNAFNGIEKGIKYQLISADFVQFQPKLVV